MTRLRLDRSEVERRMPPVTRIDDRELQMRTVRELGRLPAYFWDAPATSSDDYHNEFGRGRHGLWIHTLMSCTALRRIADSYVEQDRLTRADIDRARAALLLHDGRKYGQNWHTGKSAAKDHDLQMSRRLDEQDFATKIVGAVASHMGAWYAGPQPQTPLERLVHHCDMMASARHVTPAVYDPPAELVEVHPDLPRAGVSDSCVTRDDPDRSMLTDFGGGDDE
jgi:hypothetical protein